MYGRLHRTNLGGASAGALGSGPDDSDQLHGDVVVPAAVVGHSDQLLAAVLEAVDVVVGVCADWVVATPQAVRPSPRAAAAIPVAIVREKRFMVRSFVGSVSLMTPAWNPRVGGPCGDSVGSL